MPITRTPIVDDDGTGTTGTVLDNAWKQQLYDQIDGIAPSAWQNVPFAAANFVGAGGLVWTVGAAAILQNRYALVGNTMFWSLYVSWYSGANVLSGTPNPVVKLITPGGKTPRSNQIAAINYCGGMGGIPTIGGIYGNITNAIEINKYNNANFVLADIPGLISLMVFEVL